MSPVRVTDETGATRFWEPEPNPVSCLEPGTVRVWVEYETWVLPDPPRTKICRPEPNGLR